MIYYDRQTLQDFSKYLKIKNKQNKIQFYRKVFSIMQKNHFLHLFLPVNMVHRFVLVLSGAIQTYVPSDLFFEEIWTDEFHHRCFDRM